MCRTAVRVAALSALAAACSSPPAASPLPASAPTAPLTRTLTGTMIPLDAGTLLFVEPGRSLSLIYVDAETRYEDPALPDVASMAQANLQGLAVAATVTGLDLGPDHGYDRTLARSVHASPLGPAVSYEVEGPRLASVGTNDVVYTFRFAGASRWSWLVTAWTTFDPTGDFRSAAALRQAGLDGELVWLEGESAVIAQQLTLMRRVRAWRQTPGD